MVGVTKPIETFDYDRPYEEWTDEELDELFDALEETDTRLGRRLAKQRGGGE